ncbi:hypothetical protein Asppvi_003825 [Aspergillus pseudoviridinutans]|uniref:Protein kinase domain-containing protein n=1 Tax=Aspergillus pseudoviridinutans TaxID=1517512 RepID=A0A9P3ETP6_9EURO|nr:uncharacterized protein Asppvi_003825 [Aspergillus pseudoviridinutans]GIJ84970.1 hypothetical protein Asppvi_003825 [Aspergillus pseudoviridinutans]
MEPSDSKRITQFVIERPLERASSLGTSPNDGPMIPAPAVTRPRKRRFSQDYIVPSSVNRPIVRYQSPWDFYERGMEVKLDMWHWMTKRRDGTKGVFAVRTFPQEGSELVLKRCTTLAHPNLVACYEAFRMESAKENLFVVSECLLFSLDHVVACGEIPSDGELASIMGQILDALSYLHSQSLSHGSLTCSNTLVGLGGVIKIAGYWGSNSALGTSGNTGDVNAAGHIMMQLMQDHQSTDGNIRVVDSQRSVEAVDFLAAIESGSSASELLKHEYLAVGDGKPKWNPSQLSYLLSVTAYSSQVCYRRQKKQKRL